MEPEAVAEGEGGGWGGEEEVKPRGEAFDAEEGGGCGEGEEVYAAEDGRGEVEQDESWCWVGGHLEMGGAVSGE